MPAPASQFGVNCNPSFGQAHVLAVDNDPFIRQLVSNYRGDSDLRVSIVHSGREAVAVMDRDAADLVLPDLRLPDEDGLQIARQL